MIVSSSVLASTGAVTTVTAHFGSNISSLMKERLTNLLRTGIPGYGQKVCQPNSKHIDLYFGNHPGNQILQSEKNNLSSDEGFIIKSVANAQRPANCISISVDGRSSNLNRLQSLRGVNYGSYAVLQDLGFKFLHPLKPQSSDLNLEFANLLKTSRTEEPYWETRGAHLHTMHPLELTNLLNGWGVSGPDDIDGWTQMLPYWSLYLEWLTAHKQNSVEWILLASPKSASFNQSNERQTRLLKLTSMAKALGLEVGIVTPVRFVQQNGWTLLRDHKARKNKPNEVQDNITEILSNLNWILNCGFTYVGGELGEGEFTSTQPETTILELNAIADHLSRQNPPVPYRVKIHISQNQKAKGYLDPMTKKDINFNYLPLYTNSNVGVMPHTVQIYSLSDPAPTYENKNFTDMFRFLKMGAAGTINKTQREVIFYPETSYWVSYDVDVPLFLPVYPYRRVHDLRLIAQDELSGDMKRSSSRMNGQIFFSSGWEFGYWFNDVITAEAAWNPHLEETTSLAAFQKIISKTLRLSDNRQDIANLLASIADHQQELLVEGKVNSKSPSKIEKRTGIAYLAGVEAFDEIPMWMLENLPGFIKHKIPLTQPNKFRDDWAFKPRAYVYLNEKKYNKELRPLLNSMADIMQADADQMKNLASSGLDQGLQAALQEWTDGTQITANRARFVFNLYENRLAKAKAIENKTIAPTYENLHSIIDSTTRILEMRKTLIPMNEQHKGLLTDWTSPTTQNPTVYHFGYVWSAYNLYYWKRELNKIEDKDTEHKTCYMNIVKPSEVVGQTSGTVIDLENFLNKNDIARSCTQIPDRAPDLVNGW